MPSARSLLIAIVLTAMGTGSALADTFNFSFTAQDFSGSGQLITVETAPGSGVYQIESATGTVDTGIGKDKTLSLADNGTFQYNDNLLYYPSYPGTMGQFFDFDGVSFLLSNGAEVNLFLEDGAILMRSNGNTIPESASISVIPTPEPSSLILLGSGLIGGLVTIRRRVFA